MHPYKEKALALDASDPLQKYKECFSPSKQTIYFCNNSLGLPPRSAFSKMQEEMQKWSEIGVEGWFQGKGNWYSILDEKLRPPLSHLLGAKNEEVAVMNSLTVNLHLLMTSFYQPDEKRFKILIDAPTFPSDLYAIKSHIKNHGFDPEEVLLVLTPRPNEHLLRQEDIEETIFKEGESIALIFINPVNFLTGQVIDTKAIAKLGHEKGCLVGCDIAHAAGNIPLELHAWDIDFAVGCSYKYLCSGPGGPGLAFVHESHHHKQFPRLSGWWGNDPKKRFQMQLQEEFIPYGGAASWQVSTPSILAMTPLAASLEIYEEASISALRTKSVLQTAFLLELLEKIPAGRFSVITPKDPEQRGCQLSLLIHEGAEDCQRRLEQAGLICDFRPPNIIRATPSPLYNSFLEIFEFANRFAKIFDMEISG